MPMMPVPIPMFFGGGGIEVKTGFGFFMAGLSFGFLFLAMGWIQYKIRQKEIYDWMADFTTLMLCALGGMIIFLALSIALLFFLMQLWGAI